ncbi:interferon-inducible GTPase 5-like [Hyperolius riggenbachi]|uniref:interferon-inducible GTPase 5-like n=1 Tax=Hyperolius riggenbachi TaxID=752182 RepID=UPI0035A2B8B2
MSTQVDDTFDLNDECNEIEMEEIEEIRSAIEDVDFSRAVQKIKQRLEELARTPTNIAVTGESGSGKSTFINAIRGLTAQDEGAAKVGAVETTMDPTPYPHPHYENVKWWDLPGIGTLNFKAESYVKTICFFRYDFFIIIASGRFRESHAQLALAIQDMKKKFYFVRSKIDVDISSMRRQTPNDFDEEVLLQEIKEDCTNNLVKLGIEDPKVFLIESLEINKYDFQILQQTLGEELPRHKGKTFLLSLPDLSLSVLEKKRDALKQDIWKKAMVSCSAAIIPIPGLGFACDVAILVTAMREYQRVFGLDEQSLHRLSKTSGRSIEDLKSLFPDHTGTSRDMETPGFDTEEIDPDEEWVLLEDKDIQEIRSAIDEVNFSKAVEKIKQRLEELGSIPLNIAITGESGTGKSTFVNVIRGLSDEDEGAAETGVVETTAEPTAYSHPDYENVKWWDLPGIGTPNFKAEDYLEAVNFSFYDFFIIISSQRFKECNLQLALAIQQMGKKFYFVRSKVDEDIYSTKKRKPKSFDEEALLKKIRADCTENFAKEDINDPKLFLLSLLDKDKYDFDLLQESLEKELPSHKRTVFLLSLPNISRSVLERKREALKQQIWKKALLSCTAAAIPIPGLGFACDVTILVKAMREYQRVFGLDDESLGRLSRTSGKSIEDLKSSIKSPLVVGEINKEIVIKMLTKGTMGTVVLAEHFLNKIPLLGSLAAGGLAFATTNAMLQGFLKESVEDAQRVLIKASEDSVD